MNIFRTIATASGALVFSTISASAQERGGWLSGLWDQITGGGGHSHGGAHHNVPEIDASSGLLALAAVLAALALAWEIRRRRS